MAKKIKLDFSKVEQRSSFNTKHIEPGLYPAKIAAMQETEAQDGTKMLVYSLTPTDSRFKTRNFPYYCKLQQNQFWKLRDLLVAAGESVPTKVVQIDPEKIVGQVVAIEVEDDMYNGIQRSTVSGIYGIDILGDEEPAEQDEADEDEDELEEDELAEDDDDLEDEDLEDDEEEDDWEDDEEDEDEDDEDWLDDEDEEEEEEEPEPEPEPKKAKTRRTARRR